MAGIYLVLTSAIAAIFWGRRKLAMALVFIGLLLILLMLWHHATNILEINL